MILFVNGPFGVGKTAITEQLATRLPGCLVIDPEKAGHMLWSQLPHELRREEFELEPVWPPLTRCLVEEVAAAYQREILVPMTIVRPTVFDGIVGALRRQGRPVRHITLMARPETIRARLRSRMLSRGERPDTWGPLSWEGLQVERCLTVLGAPEYAEHIATDDRTPGDIADEVLSRIR